MAELQIRVATYNIHKAVGADRQRKPERIIEVLNELDADIVALQEADRRFGRREAVIPAFLFAAHSAYRPLELDVQTDSMGWHGNIILVKKDIDVLAQDVLHIPCLEPRGCVMATVRVRANELNVFGMHLDLSGLWRRRQARHIIELAQQKAGNRPTILMGDLNEWRPNGGCLKDFGRNFAMVEGGPSFPARRPLGRLDRIFVSDHFESSRSGALSSSISRIASDHLPVWADLRLRPIVALP